MRKGGRGGRGKKDGRREGKRWEISLKPVSLTAGRSVPGAPSPSPWWQKMYLGMSCSIIIYTQNFIQQRIGNGSITC